MATIKLYLDTRRPKANGKYALRLVFTHRSHSVYYNMGVDLLPDQWDERGQRVVHHPQKDALNRFVQNRYVAFDNELMRLIASGEARSLNATEIKQRITEVLEPKPQDHTGEVVKAFEGKISMVAAARTKELYALTLKKMGEYCNVNKLRFQDITPEWLNKFNDWRAEKAPSQNARNIDLRNIRAVIMYARKKGLTECYPFLMYSVKPVPTRKRALKLADLRKLLNWEVKPSQRRYLDYFELMLYLIGINLKDLAYMKKSDYNDGRIHYIRYKGGREYDIKVEPEAAALIKKYQGDGDYLVDIMNGRKNYKTFMSAMNGNLQRIGVWEYLNNYGKAKVKALNEELSGYWARHTWATIARVECGISYDDVRLSLGHGAKTVTDIYINEDTARVDAANRKVIDCILGLGDFAPKPDKT